MTPLNVNTHNLFSTESLTWLSNLVWSQNSSQTLLQEMLSHFLGGKMGGKKHSLNIKKSGFGGGRPDPDCSAAILAEHQRYRHRQHITVRPSGILLLQPRRSAPSCVKSFIFTMVLAFS